MFWADRRSSYACQEHSGPNVPYGRCKLDPIRARSRAVFQGLAPLPRACQATDTLVAAAVFSCGPEA